MCLCKKCSKMSAALFLIVGILLLLSDLSVISLGGVSSGTLLFIVIGVMCLAMNSCPDCNACWKKK